MKLTYTDFFIIYLFGFYVIKNATEIIIRTHWFRPQSPNYTEMKYILKYKVSPHPTASIFSLWFEHIKKSGRNKLFKNNYISIKLTISSQVSNINSGLKNDWTKIFPKTGSFWRRVDDFTQNYYHSPLVKDFGFIFP